MAYHIEPSVGIDQKTGKVLAVTYNSEYCENKECRKEHYDPFEAEKIATLFNKVYSLCVLPLLKEESWSLSERQALKRREIVSKLYEDKTFWLFDTFLSFRKNNGWITEKKNSHDKIMKTLTSNALKEKKAILLTGPLSDYNYVSVCKEVDTENYVFLHPAKVNQLLAERTLLKNGLPIVGLTLVDSLPLVEKEGKYLLNSILEHSIENHLNIILELSLEDYSEDKMVIEALLKSGYKIEIIDKDISVERALRKSLEYYIENFSDPDLRGVPLGKNINWSFIEEEFIAKRNNLNALISLFNLSTSSESLNRVV